MNTLYDKYTKVIEADFPRFCLHSTIPTGASLSIVFDHYRIRNEFKDQRRKQLNLYFLCGTGMNKAVWKYHIDKLYSFSEAHPELSWQLANCVAMDLVNHGESAVENDGKLGWEFDWREGSHDIIQVAKSLRLPGDNVLIGHSMGGFQTLYATTVAPLLFKFAIAVEPVTPNDYEKGLIFINKRLPLVGKLIRSKFKDEADFYDHFNNKSFYNAVHPQIKQDFFEAEKVIHRDGTVSSKCTKEQQQICYLAAIKQWNKAGRDILSMVPVPVIHVIGASGKWNPQDAIDEASSLIPTVENVYIKGGTHLVHMEQPDDTLEVFLNGLNKYIKNDDSGAQKYKLSKEEYNKVFKENYNAVSGMDLLNKYAMRSKL